MRLSIQYQTQIIDIELADTLKIKQIKEELHKIYQFPKEYSMKVRTKNIVLKEEKRLNDYPLSDGDLIRIEEW